MAICYPLSACSLFQNKWPRMTLSANFTSKSVFDQQGCRALTFALARLSCLYTFRESWACVRDILIPTATQLHWTWTCCLNFRSKSWRDLWSYWQCSFAYLALERMPFFALTTTATTRKFSRDFLHASGCSFSGTARSKSLQVWLITVNIIFDFFDLIVGNKLNLGFQPITETTLSPVSPWKLDQFGRSAADER